MTIAAAESADPGNAVARAVNSVVARVLVFYVASIALIVAIVPWTSVKVGVSPFSVALDRVGIPGSGDVMAAVILTAVLSCLNSGLYTGSRMLFALSVGLSREASERLKLRMWLFPWLSAAAIIVMADALISMAFIPAVRAQLLLRRS